MKSGYPISVVAFKNHILTSEYIVEKLKSTREEALYELLRLFKDYGKCQNYGIECISSIKYNRREPFPVICIDVHIGNAAWNGYNIPFYVENLKFRKGFLVIRNLDVPFPEDFEKNSYLEIIRQHEIIHILQCLSGRDEDLFLQEDLELANSNSHNIPCIAAKGSLSKKKASGLAERFFLQHLKNEIDVYNTVDFPFYRDAYKKDQKGLEELRKGILCSLLEGILWPTGCAFIDTYRIPWQEWISSFGDKIDSMISDTFLETPFCFANGNFSVYSFLKSVQLETGVIKNKSLSSGVFKHLTSYIRQIDSSTAVYNEKTEEAKKIQSFNNIQNL